MKKITLIILLLTPICFTYGQLDRLVTLRNVNAGKGTAFAKHKKAVLGSQALQMVGIVGSNTVGVGGTISFSGAIPGGTWSSSSAAIATVDPASGLVTGVGPGSCTITYTTGGTSTTINITVVTVAPISGNTQISVGGTTMLHNATPGGTWSTSNSAVASIITTEGILTGCRVTGAATGAANITYTTSGGTATVAVNVGALSAIAGPTTVKVGKTIHLSNAAGVGVWTPSNATATVDGSGSVEGISEGIDTITYTNGSNATTIAITITSKNLDQNNINVSSQPTLTLPDIFSGNNSSINYVPYINFIGGYCFADTITTKKSPILLSANANFFTGGISQFTSKKQVFNSYLTPEASTWGVNLVDFTLGAPLKPKKGTHNLAGRIQLDFLGKKLATFDSLSGKNANNASSMSTHVKFGLEYMPFTDFLKIYLNVNVLYSVTNIDTLQSYFKLSSTKALAFWDFGVRLPVTLASGSLASNSGSTSSTSFYVDVNFIPIVGQMQPYYATNDKLIMSLKVGIIQNIGIKTASLKTQTP